MKASLNTVLRIWENSTIIMASLMKESLKTIKSLEESESLNMEMGSYIKENMKMLLRLDAG